MRTELSRLAPPAALLLAITVALLLVRSAIGDDDPSRQRAALTPPAAATGAPPATRPARTAPRPPVQRQQFHEITAGDTLGGVADRYETTLEAVLGLNPGVDPTGLQVGQRIRVK